MTRPLRAGLAGLGSAALRAHLPALTSMPELVSVVAVCDPDPSHRGRALEAVPGATAHASLRRMLDAATLDAVVIATPPSVHLDQIERSLDAGAGVVCEKPLGIRAGDTQRLEQAAARHPGAMLATVLQYRHADAWAELAGELAGALATGTPVEVLVTVERPGTDPLAAAGWRSHPVREGGILGDHAVHYLGMLHDALPGLRVAGAERTGRGGHEHATVALRRPGATVRLDLSYAATSRRNRIEIRCGGAVSVWDGGSLVRGADPGVARTDLSDRDTVNALYAPFYRDLLGAWRDPDEVARRRRETLRVAALVEAAEAAASRTRRSQPGRDAA